MHTVLRSATREVVIGDDQPFCLMGERINPTGRKIFAGALRKGDLSRIAIDVEQQVAGGATMLDVNMGVPLADEAELLAQAVTMIQGLTDLPLVIDSSVVEALEAGLGAYQGKALVNSVTGEKERLEAILPIVARHGAAVIALPNEEDEIPDDPYKRLDITKKIVDIATGEYGIPLEDIVIDPLAMPIGADTTLVTKTLQTIQLIHDELGLNMTLGASNVSFGMPGRHALGAAFLPMAMRCGLTSAIMDVRSPQIVEAVKAADLLLGNDEWGMAWIARAPGGRRGGEGRGREVGLIMTVPASRPRIGSASTSTPTGPSPARSGCPPGPRCSTPPAGTASPWTPPAAGTAPAASARCRWSRARCAVSRLDPRAFSPDELRAGWRLACRAQATQDLRVGGAAAGHAAQGGHRRRRAAGDPAARAAEAVRGAVGADAGRPAHRRRTRCATRWTTSTCGWTSRQCGACHGRCGQGRRSPRWSWTTC